MGNTDNSLRRQAYCIADVCRQQAEHCFRPEILNGLLSADDVRGKIILTGCGDSLVAVGAVAKALQHVYALDQAVVMDPMEFTRCKSRRHLWAGRGAAPLVIVVSASGSAPRIVEIMKKARHCDAKTILITNQKKSPAADEADYLLLLNDLKTENSPGFCSYMSSLVGVMSVFCRIGILEGHLPEIACEEWKQAIIRYTVRCVDALPTIDKGLLALAEQYGTCRRNDCIGDNAAYYSAQLVVAKAYETTGVLTACQNSEDWCHVNNYCKSPESIGTFALVSHKDPSYSRMLNTVRLAGLINRPVILFTDREIDLGEKVRVCVYPEAEQAYPWTTILFDYVPASMLLAYGAMLTDKRFFGGSFHADISEFRMEGKALKAFANTPKSEIVVCD